MILRTWVRPEREITEVDPGIDLPMETRPLTEPPEVTRLRKNRTARKKPPKLPPVVEVLRRAGPGLPPAKPRTEPISPGNSG